MKNLAFCRMIRAVALRLMHIVDEATAEDGLRLLSLLLTRLPAGEVQQEVVVVGRPLAALSVPAGIAIHKMGPRLLGWGLSSSVDLQRIVAARRPDLLHAWSGSASALAGPAAEDSGRISVTLSSPAEARTASRWWRSRGALSKGVAVCSAKLVKRKLVEAGVPAEATLVIRPGVDFGEIRAAQQRVKREDLGLSPEGRVLLTSSPPTREGGHFMALWATAMLHQIWPEVRLIIPGESREQRRLSRLVSEINCPEAFLLVENRYSPAELLAVADALVVPATGDVPTGWLAWAMAASVPIIGSAVPSVAEFIADRQNGFLCHPGEVHSLAIRIRTAFDSPDLLRACAEAARGQAYDVFRAQACVDQYLRLFQNLHAGRPSAEGVRDMALDA